MNPLHDPVPPQTNGLKGTQAGGSVMVGVFDSGVGGLSVLPALRQWLPEARLLYVADSGHAPYGERDDAWLQARCLQIAEFLRRRGAQLLVMACNTATAAAAPALRQRHPDWPIVGMEPGIKPAIARSKNGRVGVMATTATLRSERYARLLALHGTGAHVQAQACTGLALAIERGDKHEIESLVAHHTRPLMDAGVDTVVLGCTHYAFARPWIAAAMGTDVAIIDTADAVARRTADLAGGLEHRGHADADEQSWTSGDPSQLQDFAQRWLGWTFKAGVFSAPPPQGLAA